MKTVGGIEIAPQHGLTSMPQRAASAWSFMETNPLAGASYVPIAYVGSQVTRGVEYWFIAEQTIVLSEPERHIVKMAIVEFNGEYSLVPHSIEKIF